jgi:hypothetical protein
MIRFSPISLPSINACILNLAEYVNANITVNNINSQGPQLIAIQQTLLNMLTFIEAYYVQLVMSQEVTLLDVIDLNHVGLTPTQITLVNNRITAIDYLNNTLYTQPFWLNFNVANISNALPALPEFTVPVGFLNVDLLTYYITFNGEVPPVGISVNNFVVNAEAAATAWAVILNYLTNNAPVYQTVSYDPTNRMYQSSQDTINLFNNFLNTINFALYPNLNWTTAWNTLIALPSILRVASLLMNDASTLLYQAINTFKYLLLILLQQTNILITSFGLNQIPSFPAMAKIRQGESLMDFANRTTGNYENWATIANINGLLPPYVGIVRAPNIATPGTNLYLQPITGSTAPLANYISSFLGTDINLGAVDSQLELWFGDFQLITGVPNYQQALNRRVLTPVGSLLYHSQYGSLLPSKIGTVQALFEVPFLAAYLKSALLADPRTGSVNNLQTIPLNNSQVALTAVVTPQGESASTQFNLVLTRNTGGSSNS